MAKATIDFTLPCAKCRSTKTVEIQKWTHGPDHEREVYLKCLECRSETLFGVFRLYGNSLVNVDDIPSHLKSRPYSSSEPVSTSTNSSTYSSSSSSGSTNRGCLVGCIVLIAVVALIGMIWAAVVINTSTTTSQQPSPQQPQTVGTMRAINANELNLRSGPGRTNPVLRVFTRNERIVTYGDPQIVDGEQWIQASTPDGQTRGWIARKFLTP